MLPSHYLALTSNDLDQVRAKLEGIVGRGLARSAGWLLGHLARLGGRVWAGSWSRVFRLEELARDVGASVRSVRRWLAALRIAGVVERVNHGRAGVAIRVPILERVAAVAGVSSPATSAPIAPSARVVRPSPAPAPVAPTVDPVALRRAVDQRKREREAAIAAGKAEPPGSWPDWLRGTSEKLAANPDELAAALERAFAREARERADAEKAAAATRELEELRRKANERARSDAELEELYAKLDDATRAEVDAEVERMLPPGIRSAPETNGARRSVVLETRRFVLRKWVEKGRLKLGPRPLEPVASSSGPRPLEPVASSSSGVS